MTRRLALFSLLALLADPEWPNKLRDGHSDTIIPFSPELLEALR